MTSRLSFSILSTGYSTVRSFRAFFSMVSASMQVLCDFRGRTRSCRFPQKRGYSFPHSEGLFPSHAVSMAARRPCSQCACSHFLFARDGL